MMDVKIQRFCKKSPVKVVRYDCECESGPSDTEVRLSTLLIQTCVTQLVFERVGCHILVSVVWSLTVTSPMCLNGVIFSEGC